MMPKKENNLDVEERDLLTTFEKGELKSVKNVKAERRIAEQASKHFLRKDARINIRLSSYDLDQLKRIAVLEGLCPTQH
jgi:predicted DNA binding CopG/RHH family protein